MGVINNKLITRVTNLYIWLSDVVCKIASNDIDKKSPLFLNFDKLNLCLCFLQINHTGSYLAISTKWLKVGESQKLIYIVCSNPGLSSCVAGILDDPTSTVFLFNQSHIPTYPTTSHFTCDGQWWFKIFIFPGSPPGFPHFYHKNGCT